MRNLPLVLLLIITALCAVAVAGATPRPRKVRGKQRASLQNGKLASRQLMHDSGDSNSYEYNDNEGEQTSIGNIFVHPSVNAEVQGYQTMEVQCGSTESPFLTTFVASLDFRQTPLEGSSSSSSSSSGSKSKSGKSKKSTKSGKGSSASTKSSDTLKSQKASGKGASKKSGSKQVSGDGYYVDLDGEQTYDDLPEDVPSNELTVSEQQALQQTFRDVYNHLTFQSCDGFFRTVYTATMTLAGKDDVDADGNYQVTLPRALPDNDDDDDDDEEEADDDEEEDADPTSSPNDAERRRLPAKEPKEIGVDSTSRDNKRHINTDLQDEPEQDAERFLQGNYSSRQGYWATPENYASDGEDDTDQSNLAIATDPGTVLGDNDTTIYFVTLTATCRNCEVTPEVNFPLLMVPEEDMETDTQDFDTRQGGDLDDDDEPSMDYNSTDVCTCPAGADVSYQRRNRKQRQRRLDGHDLFVPPAYAPTAEEFIQAMNQAIQQTPILNRRLLGLAQIVEPDYFAGENPRLNLPDSPGSSEDSDTTAPTVTPLTRPPRPTARPTTAREPDSVTDEAESAGVSQHSLMSFAIGLLSMVWCAW